MSVISRAELSDAAEILALQKLAYQSEARIYNDWTLAPLTQTLEGLRSEFARSVVLKAVSGERIVGSVRGRLEGDTCAIGRLIVHPAFQHQGIGSQLLRSIELACRQVRRFELFTGSRSTHNLRLYERHGYVVTRSQALTDELRLVFLEKKVRLPTDTWPDLADLPA